MQGKTTKGKSNPRKKAPGKLKEQPASPEVVQAFIQKIHAAADFKTFSKETRAYAKVLGCTINEKELAVMEQKRKSILEKTNSKIDIFYCPCVIFKEELICSYRCPCMGNVGSPNHGHLIDIAESGRCYCKLYVKEGVKAEES